MYASTFIILVILRNENKGDLHHYGERKMLVWTVKLQVGNSKGSQKIFIGNKEVSINSRESTVIVSSLKEKPKYTRN
jgi:hypothetical protein